jgi:hypothetical protein
MQEPGCLRLPGICLLIKAGGSAHISLSTMVYALQDNALKLSIHSLNVCPVYWIK